LIALRDAALVFGGNAGNAARHNFSAFGNKSSSNNPCPSNRYNRARLGAGGGAESGAAFCRFSIRLPTRPNQYLQISIYLYLSICHNFNLLLLIFILGFRLRLILLAFLRCRGTARLLAFRVSRVFFAAVLRSSSTRTVINA
jgi:hypothetical protein